MSCLLHFPVTLPPNAIVMWATLDLHVLNSSTQQFQFWKLTSAWDEVVATWQNRITTHLWQADGARGSLDRDNSAPVDAHYVSMTGPVQLDLSNMAWLVQAWAAWPSSNHGILITSTANTDGFSFATKENASFDHPTLTVGYKLP
jgi:hypothetical protein